MCNNKILHSIVLAAGRGSRMDNLTRDKPKCMVELAGKTLLEWQLNAMMTSGVENILVVVGYLYNKVKGNYSIIRNPRWYETNMVTTLTYASKWLEKFTCIISYSDILYHQSHVKKISEADGDIVVTYDRLWLDLWKERFSDPLSDAESFIENNGILKEIGERTDNINRISGQYMGLLKISPEGWRNIMNILNEFTQEKIDKLDMTSLLGLLLDRDILINVVPIDGKWCEVDSGEDLDRYEKMIAEVDSIGKCWSHDWRW